MTGPKPGLQGATETRNSPFWKTTPLDRMTEEQWESLCDRCGRCCLHKIEDVSTGRLYYTSLACYLLDAESCLCGNYEKRQELIPWCISLTPATACLQWLPATCAYRRIAEGRDLAWWHPLVSGTGESVHQAGISVRSMVLNKALVQPDNLEEYLAAQEQGTLFLEEDFLRSKDEYIVSPDHNHSE